MNNELELPVNMLFINYKLGSGELLEEYIS